jgi:hypothetical protein
MRKLVIISTCLLIAYNSVSQNALGYLSQYNAYQYNWQDVKPKGKIKRYKETYFPYNQTQGQYILGYTIIREFNTNYQLVRDKASYSSFKIWTNLYYNSFGQVKVIDNTDTLGNISKRECYQYDDMGRVIKWAFFSPDTMSGRGKLVIHYVANEKITLSSRLYQDTAMFLVDTTKYDSHGKWIERDTYSQMGLGCKIFVGYDTIGNIISCKVFGKGYPICGYQFKYDDKGNMSEEIQDSIADPYTYYPDGFHPSTIQLIYKYDKNGNWTEKQEIINGTLYSTTKRELEYY